MKILHVRQLSNSNNWILVDLRVFWTKKKVRERNKTTDSKNKYFSMAALIAEIPTNSVVFKIKCLAKKHTFETLYLFRLVWFCFKQFPSLVLKVLFRFQIQKSVGVADCLLFQYLPSRIHGKNLTFWTGCVSSRMKTYKTKWRQALYFLTLGAKFFLR
jgi:hypothetical protein